MTSRKIRAISRARLKPNLRSLCRYLPTEKSSANSISTATSLPHLLPNIRISCSIAPGLWERSWKPRAHESRERQGTRAGDRPRVVELDSAQLSPIARASRSGRLLGLHLRQLHPNPSICTSVARALPRQGTDGHRRAYAGVYFRAVRIQRGARHPRVRAYVSH